MAKDAGTSHVSDPHRKRKHRGEDVTHFDGAGPGGRSQAPIEDDQECEMRARAERQSGDQAAGDAPCELAARRGRRCSLDQQEGQHEHHAEHVGERETGLEPVERRQRHDQRGAQRHLPIISPPIDKVEHRGDRGAGQGRDERERGRVIGDDTINEFSRSDVDRIAGRMRLVPARRRSRRGQRRS